MSGSRLDLNVTLAAKEAEAYLTSPDMGARFSACLIYAYANLPMGQIQRTRFALGGAERFPRRCGGKVVPVSGGVGL